MIAFPAAWAVVFAIAGTVVVLDANGDQRVCYDTPPTVTPVCSEPMKSCEENGVFVICEK